MSGYWDNLQRDGHGGNSEGEETINYRGILRKNARPFISEMVRRLDEKEVKAVLRGQWGTMVP